MLQTNLSSQKQIFDNAPQATSIEVRTSRTIGDVMKIIVKTTLCSLSLRALWYQLYTPIRLNQVTIVRNDFGVPFAFAVWAYISDEVAEELGLDSKRILHDTEWNEGCNLCIMEFVATGGHRNTLVKQLKSIFGPNKRPVMWIRYNIDGSIKRVVRLFNNG